MENFVIITGTITSIVAIITLSIAIVKMQKANRDALIKQALANKEISDKALSNELEIKKIDAGIQRVVSENKVEISRMQMDNSEKTRQLYSKIDELRKEMYTRLEKAIDKTEEHQKQIMKEIKDLTSQITTMCATFNEYRKIHNGDKKE